MLILEVRPDLTSGPNLRSSRVWMLVFVSVLAGFHSPPMFWQMDLGPIPFSLAVSDYFFPAENFNK